MKTKILPLFALCLLAAQIALAATQPPAAAPTPTTQSLKDLPPQSKASLKKMLTMSGRIEKSCDQRDPDSCLGNNVNKSDLAAKANEAESAPQKRDESSQIRAIDERTEIVKQLSQDCKAGQAPACKRLAVISKEMNKPRASIQLYKMACDHGDALVCKELSQSLERAGRKDLAALYLQKACQKGDTKSCEQPAAKN